MMRFPSFARAADAFVRRPRVYTRARVNERSWSTTLELDRKRNEFSSSGVGVTKTRGEPIE